MSKIWKPVLAGTIIIIIGVIVLVIGLGLNGWEYGSAEQYQMQTATLSGDYTALEVDIGVGDVAIYYDESVTELTVEYPTSKHLVAELSESGNRAKFVSKREWIFFSVDFSGLPKTIVRLPVGKTVDLTVKLSAGQIKADGEFGKVTIDMSAGQFLSDNLVCSSFNFDLSAGAARVKRLVSDKIYFDVSAGSINVDVDGLKSDYTISVDKSAGSCNVGNQTGADKSKLIDIDISAGSVTLGFLEYQNQ